jgi:Fur family peroxide stress response transcriptional regulator
MRADTALGDDSAFSRMCREHGWKRTVQRRAVFSFLRGNKEHPTVESVWRGVRVSLPDISLDSVYRILNEFADAGVIRRLDAVKIIRYDVETEPHEHFVCSQCGRMQDFRWPQPLSAADLCHEFGRVDSTELTVRGVCRMCLEKQDSAGSRM